MSVYTKRGDRGETGLYSPGLKKEKRVSKASERILAIGTVDEVNSYIGIISSTSKDKKVNKILQEIQNNLFIVGSNLAGASLKIKKEKITGLEKEMDKMEAKLPVLTTFVLPGGSPLAAQLFYLRTIVRKAERQIVKLNQKETVEKDTLEYLNRLSDYLFILARWVNFLNKETEVVWKK